jgi:cytochrome P450
MKRINDIAYKIVQDRRKEELSGETTRSTEHNCDILGLYLTRQEEMDGELTDNELRDIVLNIMLAGRDTTANVSRHRTSLSTTLVSNVAKI